MSKTRRLRIIAVAILAVVLLVASLDLLISRSDDGDSGYVAVCFVSDERLLPQMDYQLLFSSEDMKTYFVTENDLTLEEMREHVNKALKLSQVKSAVILCEGEYALAGMQIAAEETKVSDLILLSPQIVSQAELIEMNSISPAGRVAVFSANTPSAERIYERLSGEDTTFTRGTQADESAPEIFLSADARYYYARMTTWKGSAVSQERILNSPIIQTYLANYLRNFVFEKEGVSRAPLGYWILKVVCTVATIVAFFLYAATLPKVQRFTQKDHAGQDDDLPNGKKQTEGLSRSTNGKLRGRSIADKYKSALVHLMTLQVFLGVIAAGPACYFVAKGKSYFQVILLVWICVSLLSSAFYLLRFLRKIKEDHVRKNRAMWQIHLLFTCLLAADIFMLKLLWKGNGFLKLNLLLLVAILLSIMVWIAITMLQLTDECYGKNQGSTQSVIDSIIFSAIRFVPMVIVFVFSVIIGEEIYALRVILLVLALIGASYLRRVIRKGGLGELFSVILYACLYWMMF